MLAQGVSFRTNLNSDSTKLAGVDSSHTSNASTMQFCKLPISLQIIPKTNELAKCNPNKEIKLIKRLMICSSTHLHWSIPMMNSGKTVAAVMFWYFFWFSGVAYFEKVPFTHSISWSCLALKQSGPFSATNNAIWSPSLWQTKFKRFLNTFTKVCSPSFSFGSKHGSIAWVKLDKQSNAVDRLRQYLRKWM